MACTNFTDLLPDIFFSQITLDKNLSSGSDTDFASVRIGFQEEVDTQIESVWFDNLDGLEGNFAGLRVRIIQSKSQPTTEILLAFADLLRRQNLPIGHEDYRVLTEGDLGFKSLAFSPAPEARVDTHITFSDLSMQQILLSTVPSESDPTPVIGASLTTEMSGNRIVKKLQTTIVGKGNIAQEVDTSEHLSYFAFAYVDFSDLPESLRIDNEADLAIQDRFPVGSISMINLLGEYSLPALPSTAHLLLPGQENQIASGPGQDLLIDLRPIRKFKQAKPSAIASPRLDPFYEIESNLAAKVKGKQRTGLKRPAFSVLWDSRDLNENRRLTFAIDPDTLAKQNTKFAFLGNMDREVLRRFGFSEVIKTESIELYRQPNLPHGFVGEFESIESYPGGNLRPDARLVRSYESTGFNFYTTTDTTAKQSSAKSHNYRVIVTLKDNSFDILKSMLEKTTQTRFLISALGRQAEAQGTKPPDRLTRRENEVNFGPLVSALFSVGGFTSILHAIGVEDGMILTIESLATRLQPGANNYTNQMICNEIEDVVAGIQEILLNALRTTSPNFTPQGDNTQKGSQPGQRPRSPIVTVVQDFERTLDNLGTSKSGLEYFNLRGIQATSTGFPGIEKSTFEVRATKEIEKFYRDVSTPSKLTMYNYLTPSIIRVEDENGAVEIKQVSTGDADNTYDYIKYADVISKLYAGHEYTISPASHYASHTNTDEPLTQSIAASFRRRLFERSCQVAMTNVEASGQPDESTSRPFNFFGSPGEGEDISAAGLSSALSSPRTRWQRRLDTPTSDEPTRLLMALTGEMTQGLEHSGTIASTYNSFAMVKDDFLSGSGAEQQANNDANEQVDIDHEADLDAFFDSDIAYRWVREIYDYIMTVKSSRLTDGDFNLTRWVNETRQLSLGAIGREIDKSPRILYNYLANLRGFNNPSSQVQKLAEAIVTFEQDTTADISLWRYYEFLSSTPIPWDINPPALFARSRILGQARGGIPISLQALTDMSFFDGLQDVFTDDHTAAIKIRQPTFFDQSHEVHDPERSMVALSPAGSDIRVYDLMKDHSKFAAFWFNFKTIARIEFLSGFASNNIKDPIWSSIAEGNPIDRHPLGLYRLASYSNSKYGVVQKSTLSLPVYNEHFVLIETLSRLTPLDQALGQPSLVEIGSGIQDAIPSQPSQQDNPAPPPPQAVSQVTPQIAARPALTPLANFGQQAINRVNQPPPPAIGPIGGRIGNT